MCFVLFQVSLDKTDIFFELVAPRTFFFNVGPPKEDIFFWTPCKSYISVNFTHYNYKCMPLCGTVSNPTGVDASFM